MKALTFCFSSKPSLHCWLSKGSEFLCTYWCIRTFFCTDKFGNKVHKALGTMIELLFRSLNDVITRVKRHVIKAKENIHNTTNQSRKINVSPLRTVLIAGTPNKNSCDPIFQMNQTFYYISWSLANKIKRIFLINPKSDAFPPEEGTTRNRFSRVSLSLHILLPTLS